MPHRPEEDMVPEWRELMIRWDTASRQYGEAAALASIPGREADPELQEALIKNMEELKGLKRAIDKTIRRGKHRRLHLPGTLVVGTLEQCEPEEDHDSPADSTKPVGLERNQR